MFGISVPSRAFKYTVSIVFRYDALESPLSIPHTNNLSVVDTMSVIREHVYSVGSLVSSLLLSKN